MSLCALSEMEKVGMKLIIRFFLQNVILFLTTSFEGIFSSLKLFLVYFIHSINAAFQSLHFNP